MNWRTALLLLTGLLWLVAGTARIVSGSNLLLGSMALASALCYLTVVFLRWRRY